MRRTFWLILLLGLGFEGIHPAWAQVEEAQIDGEPGEEHDEGAIPDVIERWFNFLILFGGLGFLVRKPASAFFESRRNSIQGGLKAAQIAQHDADQRMRDVTERLSRLEMEIQAIQADADASARAERERIVIDAKREVDRALAQSQAEVDRLARGLAQQVRAQVADRVIARAEEQIRARMTPEDRQRTVRQAVEQL